MRNRIPVGADIRKEDNMIPVNELARGFRLYQKEYEDRAVEVLRSGWYVLGKQMMSFEE